MTHLPFASRYQELLMDKVRLLLASCALACFPCLVFACREFRLLVRYNPAQGDIAVCK